MIRHIVLLRFKPNLPQQTIEQVMQALADLQTDIPQIRHFSWGACNSPENLHQGFLHGFTMDFDSETDRDTYLYHPKHIAIATQQVRPNLEQDLESVVVFDYTVP